MWAVVGWAIRKAREEGGRFNAGYMVHDTVRKSEEALQNKTLFVFASAREAKARSQCAPAERVRSTLASSRQPVWRRWRTSHRGFRRAAVCRRYPFSSGAQCGKRATPVL
jgi:hypothetical protein